MPRNIAKLPSLLIIAMVYAAAGAVALLLEDALPAWHPLWIVLVCDVAATLVVFAASVAMDNTSVYDPYWSLAPLPIAAFLAHAGGEFGPRPMLIAALLGAWGARLTFNWARGWAGMGHEDWRYADFRRKTGPLYWLVSLFGLQLLPTILVFLGCLPLWPALTSRAPLGPLDLAAALVTAGAIWLETTADVQLLRFVRNGPAPEAIMKEGLWARCRHPNYLGEICFWWGLFLFGLTGGAGAWWTAAGPLAITLLFVFISIPLIDARMLRRRPGYAEHKRRVRALLPCGKRD